MVFFLYLYIPIYFYMFLSIWFSSARQLCTQRTQRTQRTQCAQMTQMTQMTQNTHRGLCSAFSRLYGNIQLEISRIQDIYRHTDIASICCALYLYIPIYFFLYWFSSARQLCTQRTQRTQCAQMTQMTQMTQNTHRGHVWRVRLHGYMAKLL
jgi:hypothetical protein